MSYLVGNPAPRAPMFDAVGAVLSFLRERGVASERDVLRALAESEERHAERHGLRPPVGKPLAAVRLLLALENRGRIVRTAGDGQDGGVAYVTKHRDGCGDIVISESDMAFTESAREDVPDMLAKIEEQAAEIDFYKRREKSICDAVGGVADGGKYRADIIDALRNRLKPGGPLTEETKRDIRQAFANLCGAGVPEEGLAYMLATHAIGLLENQRPEWFAKKVKP